jgi:beta-lactam-binding protein with PASTA domain
VVPDVLQDDVAHAFVRLRNAGLRVAIAESFRFAESHNPGPSRQDPASGERVAAGTVVTLSSLAGPQGLLVAFRRDEVAVPDLVDLSVDEAVVRLERACLLWGVRFAPLPPSDAPSLFAAYRVRTQKPEAGQRQRQLEQHGSTTSIRSIGLRAVPLG